MRAKLCRPSFALFSASLCVVCSVRQRALLHCSRGRYCFKNKAHFFIWVRVSPLTQQVCQHGGKEKKKKRGHLGKKTRPYHSASTSACSAKTHSPRKHFIPATGTLKDRRLSKSNCGSFITDWALLYPAQFAHFFLSPLWDSDMNWPSCWQRFTHSSCTNGHIWVHYSRMQRIRESIHIRTMKAKRKVEEISKEDVQAFLKKNAFVLFTVGAVVVGVYASARKHLPLVSQKTVTVMKTHCFCRYHSGFHTPPI